MPPTIPRKWKSRVAEHLGTRRAGPIDCLSADDFPPDEGVVVRFPDGSLVLFRYAFAVADEAAGEVAVFTEHCGHHFFPLAGAEVETLPLFEQPG